MRGFSIKLRLGSTLARIINLFRAGTLIYFGAEETGKALAKHKRALGKKRGGDVAYGEIQTALPGYLSSQNTFLAGTLTLNHHMGQRIGQTGRLSDRIGGYYYI